MLASCCGADLTCGNTKDFTKEENPTAREFNLEEQNDLGLLEAFPRILLILSNKLAGSAVQSCALGHWKGDPGDLSRGIRVLQSLEAAAVPSCSSPSLSLCSSVLEELMELGIPHGVIPCFSFTLGCCWISPELLALLESLI